MGLFSFLTKKKHSSSLSARESRVTLVPLHQIFLDINSPVECAKVPLANISTSGLGFFKEKCSPCPPVGTLMSGTLHFQNKSLNLQLKIIHKTSIVVGCCFSHLPENFEKFLLHYFELELSAMKLGKIAPKYLKKESDGEAHWFRGSDNCELFLVVSDEEIVRFTISFFGNLIEYRQKKNVRYSRMEHEENTLKMKGSELIRYETSVPKEIGESSIKFVMNIKELSDPYRDFICSVVKHTLSSSPDQGVNHGQ